MIFRLLALLALPVLAYTLTVSLSRRYSLTPRQNRILFAIVAALLVIGVLVIMGRLPVQFILAPLGAAGAFFARFLPTLLRLLPFWSMLKSQVAGATGNNRAANQASTIRTEYLLMSLAHSTGDMDGEVLKGSHKGSQLSGLGLSELLRLRAECSSDPDSLQILEAYLDRTHEDWREQAEGRGEAASDQAVNGVAPVMSESLAREILGLDSGIEVDRKTIVKAHRNLMQKLHPDRGGNDYLAQQINAAKDFLLRNRRA